MAKHISHFHEVLRCKQNVSTAALELFLSRNSQLFAVLFDFRNSIVLEIGRN